MNDTMERVEIPLSRVKISAGIVVALLAFLASVWLWKDPAVPHQNSTWVQFWAMGGMIFCGFAGLFLTRKLFDFAPGLIIDSIGIIDGASGVGVGRVPWTDIIGLTTRRQGRTRWVVVEVRNPEIYIRRVPWSRRWLVILTRRHPINISSIMLAIDFDDLLKLMTSFRAKFGTSAPTKGA